MNENDLIEDLTNSSIVSKIGAENSFENNNGTQNPVHSKSNQISLVQYNSRAQRSCPSVFRNPLPAERQQTRIQSDLLPTVRRAKGSIEAPKELEGLLGITEKKGISQALAVIKTCLTKYTEKHSNEFTRHSVFLSIGPETMDILLNEYLNDSQQNLSEDVLSFKGFLPPIQDFLKHVGFDTPRLRTLLHQYITHREEHLNNYKNLFKITTDPLVMSEEEKSRFIVPYNENDTFGGAVRVLFKKNQKELSNLFKEQCELTLKFRKENPHDLRNEQKLTHLDIILDLLVKDPKDKTIYYKSEISRIGTKIFRTKYKKLEKHFNSWYSKMRYPDGVPFSLIKRLKKQRIKRSSKESSEQLQKLPRQSDSVYMPPSSNEDENKPQLKTTIGKRRAPFVRESDAEESAAEPLIKKNKKEPNKIDIPSIIKSEGITNQNCLKKFQVKFNEKYPGIHCPQELKDILIEHVDSQDILVTLNAIKAFLEVYKAAMQTNSISKAFLSMSAPIIRGLLSQYLLYKRNQLKEQAGEQQDEPPSLRNILQRNEQSSDLIDSIPCKQTGFGKPIRSFLKSLGFIGIDRIYLRRFFDEYPDLFSQFADVLKIKKKILIGEHLSTPETGLIKATNIRPSTPKIVNEILRKAAQHDEPFFVKASEDNASPLAFEKELSFNPIPNIEEERLENIPSMSMEVESESTSIDFTRTCEQEVQTLVLEKQPLFEPANSCQQMSNKSIRNLDLYGKKAIFCKPNASALQENIPPVKHCDSNLDEKPVISLPRIPQESKPRIDSPPIKPTPDKGNFTLYPGSLFKKRHPQEGTQFTNGQSIKNFVDLNLWGKKALPFASKGNKRAQSTIGETKKRDRTLPTLCNPSYKFEQFLQSKLVRLRINPQVITLETNQGNDIERTTTKGIGEWGLERKRAFSFHAIPINRTNDAPSSLGEEAKLSHLKNK
ncbi:MAG: hypothetical protein H2069_06515 [Legionella sp.]|nr:hypothetical protein [Legionella sp.]